MFELIVAVVLPTLPLSQGLHSSVRVKPDRKAVELALGSEIASDNEVKKRVRVRTLQCRIIPTAEYDPDGKRVGLEAVARCSYRVSRISQNGWSKYSDETSIFVYLHELWGDEGRDESFTWSRDIYGS